MTNCIECYAKVQAVIQHPENCKQSHLAAAERMTDLFADRYPRETMMIGRLRGWLQILRVEVMVHVFRNN